MTPRAMRGLTLACAVAIVGCAKEAPFTDEGRRREAWIHQLAVREGLLDAWSLSSRAEIQFEDGLGPVEMIDPAVPFAGWREIARATASGPAQPVRWMGARSHLRLRGDTDMRLEILGRVDLAALMMRPVVTASLDGRELHSGQVDPTGYFRIDVTVPHAMLDGWSDLYLTLSSVHEPWRDPNALVGVKLTVARLEHVTWEPATGR
jgi:hypothetical protein